MIPRLLACFVLLAAACPAVSWAQAALSAHVPFTVDSSTSYHEGCMNGLCLCPVFTVEEVRGRFDLVPDHWEQSRSIYDVRGVRLALPSIERGPRQAIGRGTYWIDRVAGEQRMELELSLDGDLPMTFDSDVVPLTEGSIRLSLYSQLSFCFGYQFDLVAERMTLAPLQHLTPPDRAKEPAEPMTWATLKTRYR